MPETVTIGRDMVERALLMLDNIQVAKGNDNVTRMAWVVTMLQSALEDAARQGVMANGNHAE